jgi:hypothetical protein
VPARSSLAFERPVGTPVPADDLTSADCLPDPNRFSSEGYWAFCRFQNEFIPAARFGFQRGGFNPGPRDETPNSSYLQLHLEVMTNEGAILWLPSGHYSADRLQVQSGQLDIRLADQGTRIFEVCGWPSVACRFASPDGYLAVDLSFHLATITILPDNILPHCVFAMWESMGKARGTIRYGERSMAVNGTVFFDHTRVVRQSNGVLPRKLSLYTTMYFEDGSGLFGYQALDIEDRPIEDYCFIVYLDAAGQGRLLQGSELIALHIDSDRIAQRWRISYRDDRLALDLQVTVQHHDIVKCWGPAHRLERRREFSIMPLVLDGAATIAEPGTPTRTLRGWGLAEYYDQQLWPLNPLAVTSIA